MILPDRIPSPEETRVAAASARPVTLADGRAWGLALPGPRYRPEVVAGVDELGRPTETIRAAGRVGYPLAIDRLVVDLREACRAADDRRRFDALMGLAVALLRRAHDLTVEEAVALLDLDGAGLLRLVDAVLATVAGVAGVAQDPTDPTRGAGHDRPASA